MIQVYNEGRVVGLSTYELFLRNQVAAGYDIESLPSESEWLSAQVGAGCSMILTVPAESTGYVDFTLPQGCSLVGCQTLHADLFLGEVSSTGNWATSIVSYGPCMVDDDQTHPVTPGQPSNVPKYDSKESLSELRAKAQAYTMITDGLFIQPGEWDNSQQYSMLTPDKTERGFVRLKINGQTSTDVNIIISGFLPKSIVGSNMNKTAIETPGAADGDFIGPEAFPRACKIIMNTCNLVKLSQNGSLSRKLSRESDTYLKSKSGEESLIDYTCDESVLSDKHKELGIDYIISKDESFVGGSALVVARPEGVYNENADGVGICMYGVPDTASVSRMAYPLDIAVPGQLRICDSEEKASKYSEIFKGLSYGAYFDTVSGSYRIVKYDPETGQTTSSSLGGCTFTAVEGKNNVTLLASGNESRYIIDLNKRSSDGSVLSELLPLDGLSGTLSKNTICWDDLLEALKENKNIEVLTDQLKKLNQILSMVVSQSGQVEGMGITKNFIQFGDIRLYISKTQPTGDIPDGSIGIGW